MTTPAVIQNNIQRKLNRQGGRCLSIKNNAEAIIRMCEGSITPHLAEQIILHALAIQHDAEDAQNDLQETNIQIGDNSIFTLNN